MNNSSGVMLEEDLLADVMILNTDGTADDGLVGFSCEYEGGFSTMFLSLLLGLIAIGLTLTLFLLVIIAWYPDLYTSKHISQAFCLFSNLVTLSCSGFIVLSSFIPNERSCSLVLVLTHFSMFLFIISEFTHHVDFYTAIAFPFWHEYMAEKEAIMSWCVGSFFFIVSVVMVLYFTGPLYCISSCPIVPILNQSQNSVVSVILVSAYGLLFATVVAFSLHVFFIATDKLRANQVAPNVNLNHTSAMSAEPSSASPVPFEGVPPQKDAFVGPVFIHNLKESLKEKYQNTKGGPNTAKRVLFKRTDMPGKSLDDGDSGISNNEDAADSTPMTSGQAELVRQVSRAIMDRKPEKSFNEQQSRDDSLTTLQALWKAFTKSFRLSLVDIASYLLFIAPCLGMVSCPLTGRIGCGTEIFIGFGIRKFMVLLFILTRTFQPALLMVNDKILKKKIDAIVRNVLIARKLLEQDLDFLIFIPN